MERLSEVSLILMKKAEQHGVDIASALKNSEQNKINSINGESGKLTGFDCPECKNKGYITFLKDGKVTFRDCACMVKRRSQRHIEGSGLKSLLDEYTFDKYETPERWQADAKKKAQDFLTDNSGKWFLVCGTVGSGKTHLCTAICGEFLNLGKSVRYMLWRDDAVRLKACVNDDTEYARMIRPLKTCEVLYIDDLFKGGTPSEADIRLAFELLNYRYNNRALITIISTERTIPELIKIDEAVGSRIYQMSKESNLEITGQKNWRLK